MKKPLLIGIGNPLRGDDRIGIEAARSLQEKMKTVLDVSYCKGDALDLLEMWKNRKSVFLIDAVVSDTQEIGALHRFYPNKEKVPAIFTQTSTHLFDAAAVIELAQALGELPEDLVLYGIEAGNFSLDGELSSEMQRQLSNIIHTIEEDISRHLCMN